MARMVYELSEGIVGRIEAAGIELPPPQSSDEQYLVFTAQAFREHHEGFDPEVDELIASAPDELIEQYVSLTARPGEGVWTAWQDMCGDVLAHLETMRREHPERFNRTEGP
jgi:hypothetical protein